MEPTVTKNTGSLAMFSDGSTNTPNQLSEFGYRLALQPSAFINIFKIGRIKAEIRAILKDPIAVAAASKADGLPTGSTTPSRKIRVSPKGIHAITDAELNVKPESES